MKVFPVSLGIILLLFTACAKEEVGDDIAPARKGHAIIAFHSELLPLLRSFYYSGVGPDPRGAPLPCGEWELLEGDSSLFPEASVLKYRYEASDSCSASVTFFNEGSVELAFHGALDEEGGRVYIESENLFGRGLRMNGSLWVHREEDGHRFEWGGTGFLFEGERISSIGEMKVTQVHGGGTDSLVTDDTYLFEPEFKGEGIGEASYRIRAHQPLEREMGCPNPWKGTLWVKPRDLGGRELLYDQGEDCPKRIPVSVNGREKDLILF